MWIQIALIVVSLIASRGMASKPAQPKPPALGDIDFPQIDEGTPQVVVFGDCWVDSWMVLGVGNYRTAAVKAKGK